MSYFYADGNDKSGNRLITSYKKADQAKRYRAGATVTEGLKYLDVQPDGSARLGIENNGLLVRTLMLKAGDVEEMRGPFVVYARINGEWQPTSFRYPNYAAANSAVKSALINLYGACAVIEEQGEPSVTPVAVNDEAVF